MKNIYQTYFTCLNKSSSVGFILSVVILLLSPQTFAQDIFSCDVFHYSHFVDKLMHNEDGNSLYKIKLDEVLTYLPAEHGLKRNSLRRLTRGKRYRGFLNKLIKYFNYGEQEYTETSSPAELFSNLHPEMPHTYAILNDRLIFTETTHRPMQERNKDRFTKHFIISGLQRSVHYAGEFTPYLNPKNGELFLVFDNGSGTYQPASEYLPNLKILLEKNFNKQTSNMLISKGDHANKNRIFFITKTYEQKIDKKKLFSHSQLPFLD